MGLRNIVTAISLILVGLLLPPARENLAQVSDRPDLSQCDNYTGRPEDAGVFALSEHEPVGDRHKLSLNPGMRYLFRNITRNRFLAEEWNSADGGKSYATLKWRLLYRRLLP